MPGNVTAGNGLNLFYKCATECVNLSLQEEECASSTWGGSKMCTSGSIANSQRSPTEINNGAISKLRILEECRAFKAIISNEILV